MGFKPFTPYGEALSFELPPDCGSPGRDGIDGKIVSQLVLPALMWVAFIGPCVGVAQTVFFRGSYSIRCVYGRN